MQGGQPAGLGDLRVDRSGAVIGGVGRGDQRGGLQLLTSAADRLGRGQVDRGGGLDAGAQAAAFLLGVGMAGAGVSFAAAGNPATAARLCEDTLAAGLPWADIDGHVVTTLATQPWEAVSFVLHTLEDAARAWRMAHELDYPERQPWSTLAEAYDAIDPVATLPVHARLVRADLEHADAGHYRSAAGRLALVRTLARTLDPGTVQEVNSWWPSCGQHIDAGRVCSRSSTAPDCPRPADSSSSATAIMASSARRTRP